jgi:protease-4
LALSCDTIISNKSGIIGSIGVIGTAINFHGLAEKLGVKEYIFKTAVSKGGIPTAGQVDQEMIDEEQRDTNLFFEKFKNAVRMSRGHKIKEQDMPEILSARTWFAPEAQQLNLVDQIVLPEDVISDINGDCFTVHQKKKSMGILNILFGFAKNFVFKTVLKMFKKF